MRGSSMYTIGRIYRQLDGQEVLIVGIANRGTDHETVYSIAPGGDPIHRYSRRDFGRVTGTSFDRPDPRNLEVQA